MLDNLIHIQVGQVAALPHPGWADGSLVSIPKWIVEGFSYGKRGMAIQEAAEALRLRAAFTEVRPLSSRLPVSYQRVPPWLRSLLVGAMGRMMRRRQKRWADFPAWPLDLSADFLSDLAGGAPSPFANGPTLVVLTHDLDSPEGLVNLVQQFLDIEEGVGARSINYIVPCSWLLDHGLLQEVCRRGHEIGIHGFDHSNLTPFAAPEERLRRLAGAKELIERYGIIGYRAPSLLRTRELLRDLSRYYRYDSSVPTSGGLFPVPNNGCASARPFFIEGIAELPVSMPRDGSLRFLGYFPEQILTVWVECAEAISRSGGVVVLLTHCEARFSGNRTMLETYRRFLELIQASERFAWSTPREVINRGLGLTI